MTLPALLNMATNPSTEIFRRRIIMAGPRPRATAGTGRDADDIAVSVTAAVVAVIVDIPLPPTPTPTLTRGVDATKIGGAAAVFGNLLKQGSQRLDWTTLHTSIPNTRSKGVGTAAGSVTGDVSHRPRSLDGEAFCLRY